MISSGTPRPNLLEGSQDLAVLPFCGLSFALGPPDLLLLRLECLGRLCNR